MNALPFSTYASVIKISGKTLEKAIDFGSWMNRRCKRNLLQVAGIKAGVDYSKPDGSKTMIFIKVGDGYQFLDVNQEYVVVTNSYIVKGGDGFDMFEGATVEELSHGLWMLWKSAQTIFLIISDEVQSIQNFCNYTLLLTMGSMKSHFLRIESK